MMSKVIFGVGWGLLFCGGRTANPKRRQAARTPKRWRKFGTAAYAPCECVMVNAVYAQAREDTRPPIYLQHSMATADIL